MVTGANEIVQDPSRVGNAWKTISARIRASKNELVELGEETEGMFESTAKLQDYLIDMTGVDIIDAEGNFRNLKDIVVDLGKAFEKIDNEFVKQEVAEKLAGKTQMNVLLSAISNYKQIEKAYDTATKAAGSAAREQENYSKSIEYSIKQLQASVEELSYDLLNKDLVKGVVDFVNTLVQGLDSIVERSDKLVYALGGVSSILLTIKNLGVGLNYDKDKDAFSWSVLGTKVSGNSELTAIKEYVKLVDSGADSAFAFKKALNECSDSTKEYVNECVKQNKTTKEIVAGFEKGSSSGKIFATTVKTIGARLASLAINLGISLAISAITNAVIALSSAEKELDARTKELGDEYKNTRTDIADYKSEISDLYETLNDSNSSYEESRAARERLLKIQDELISKYGTEEQSIKNITDAINGQISALDNLSQAKWRETKNRMSEPEDDSFLGRLKYWWGTKANGYESEYDKAVKTMQGVNTYALNIPSDQAGSKYMDASHLSDADVRLLDSLAANYENLNLKLNENADAYYLAGDDMQLFYQSLLLLQDEVEKFGGSDDLNEYLTVTANNALKAIETNGSLYDSVIQNEKILKSANYSKYYSDIEAAVQNYNKAYLDGFEDDAARDKAVTDLASLWTDAMGSIDDAEVRSYIERQYPNIKQLVNSWEFDLKFKADEYSINSSIEEALDQFKRANGGYISYESLNAFEKAYDANPDQYDATDDRVLAYYKLAQAADKYHISVDQLNAKLKEESQLMSDDYNKLVSKYGEANISTLSPEDLAIAETYSDTILGTFDALKNKIEATKEEQAKLNAEQEEVFAWSDELNAALEKLGLAKEGRDGLEYDDSWTNYLETIKQLNPELANNQEELEKCALANMQFSKAVDDLSKNFKTYKEALKDADALTPEFSDAINALADDLTYLTGINFSIDDASKFLAEAENLQLLEQAINGSDEALQKLQAHASEAVKIHVDVSELEQLQEYTEVRIALNLDAESFNSQLQGFADWLAANENMGSIDVTALLDEFPFLAQLDDLMRESSAVAQAVKKIFDSLGWDVKWTTRKVPVATGSKIQSIYAPQEVRSKYSNAGSGAIRYDDVLVPDNFHYVPNGGRSGSKTSTSAYTPKSFSPSQKSNAASNINKANSGGGGSDSDKEDDYKESFDYFERLIKVLDKQIDLLEAHLNDVVGSFAKNTLLDAEENLVKQKMAGYSSAIDMYSAKASEALSKIPSDIAAKVVNGAVAIDDFVGESNKDVYEAIQEYEQWADKVWDCKQQIVELREALRQLELTKFKNVAQDFQELFDVRKTQIDLISKAIDLFSTARDKIVGRAFYDESIEQTEKQLNSLLEKRTALTNQMSSAIANGIEVANEEWFEMLDLLESVNADILDAQKAIEDYKNAIIQLYVDAFDREANRYSKQIALRQKAIDALERQISVVASAGNVAGREYYDQQIEQTAKQIVMLEEERRELERRLSAAIDNGVREGTDEWYSMVDAINEVDAAIQSANQSIEEYKNSIVELYMELFNREADRYSKQVELRQKAIDALANQIALVESAGNVAGEAYFKEQIKQTQEQIVMLEAERRELEKRMQEGIANGVKVGTDEWYEMVNAINEVDSAIQSAKQSVEDYKNSIIQLYVELFERESARYTNQISLRQKAVAALEKQIDAVEAAGNVVGESYIKEQIEQTQKQMAMLQKERDELVRKMSNATANGVKVGTDEWYSMVDSLNEVDTAIQECVASIEAMDDAILALHTETFDRIQQRFSSLSSEISNMADMFEDFDVATENNTWTKEGLSQLGLYAQQYEMAKKQVAQYNAEIEELNKQYATGKYSVTQYTTKLAELKDAQWNSIKAAQQAKDSIVSLNKARVDIVVEGINKEIKAFQELTDAQREQLSAEKDLHDYEKSIAESAKSITDLERQLATMADDDSAAARAKRLKLEEELQEAREELAEKEYDHSIEMQQEALAQQAEDYEEARELEIEALQATLEEEQSLLVESFNAVKENAALIEEELLLMAQNLNITMSPEIVAPWQAGEAAIASYSELLTIESSAFIETLAAVEASEWSLQEQANSTSQSISDMFGNSADNLVAQTNTANDTFREEEQAAINASTAIAENFSKQSNELVAQTNIANETFRAEEEAALRASAAIAENFSNRADSLVATTNDAYAAFREEEAAAEDASRAIADAFGNRADELVATIENARNSTENLSRMSDALADSLSNSIDGSYSGGSAVSALDSIADAANGVAEAARNAAREIENLGLVKQQSTRDVTIYGGYDGTGKYVGTTTAKVTTTTTSNGTSTSVSIPSRSSRLRQYASGIKRVSSDELAWTQEDGLEMIVSPTDGAVLTPLKSGQSVLPADQTANIWEWSKFDPTEFARKLIQSTPNTGGTVQANTMQVGSLVTVNGNINDSMEMMKIASTTASNKIKQSFYELSNGLNR